MKYPDARILVFGKAPQPGQVKTRLIPLLGTAGAARLHCTLLEHTLERMTASRLCAVEMHCAPSTTHEFFQYCLHRYDISLHQQTGADLGARMSAALQTTLQRASAAVLVGCDCPELAAFDVETALRRLQSGDDIVLGPAHDGGYYLVGMKTDVPDIFTGIPWGSDQVLSRTLQRIDRLGLNAHLLEAHRDIDTPDDYLAWRDTSGVSET